MDGIVRVARQMAEACPGMLVRQASRYFTSAFDEAYRPLGVQASQVYVLVAVATFGEAGATMRGLADALLMDRTTLTRNVQPLERSGLLHVARSPSDKRARIVLLTRAGERLVEAIPPLWTEVHERLKATLGARRLQALEQQLREAVEILSNERASAAE